MTDKAVAEADLMTLPPVREGRSLPRDLLIAAGAASAQNQVIVALGPGWVPILRVGQRSPAVSCNIAGGLGVSPRA